MFNSLAKLTTAVVLTVKSLRPADFTALFISILLLKIRFQVAIGADFPSDPIDESRVFVRADRQRGSEPVESVPDGVFVCPAQTKREADFASLPAFGFILKPAHSFGPSFGIIVRKNHGKAPLLREADRLIPPSQTFSIRVDIGVVEKQGDVEISAEHVRRMRGAWRTADME